MADLQYNSDNAGSYNNDPSRVSNDASDDTVAFERVSSNQPVNYSSDASADEEQSLADNLGEVSDDDSQYDLTDDSPTSTFGSTFGVAAGLGNGSSQSSHSAADSVATTTFKTVEPRADQHKDSAGAGAGASTKHRANRSAFALFYSLLIFVILLIAAFFGTHWYFHDRVAPGVNFGNVASSRSLVGSPEDEVSRAVEQAVNTSSLVIKDDRGNSITTDLQHLGVKVDRAATVSAIMDAKKDNMFTRIMPWVQQTVALHASRDDAAMDAFVVKKFVRLHDRAVPYSAVFDESSDSFTVEDGVPGRTVETMPVREAVKKLLAHPGQTVKVSVTSRRTDAPIKLEAAQKLVSDLNVLLAKKISFNNGNGDNFVVPKKVLASWIKVKADISRRKLSYKIDLKAADAWLSKSLPKELNKEKEDQEDAVNKDGKVLFTTLKGVNGIEITYSRDLAKKACEALTKGEDANIAVPGKVTKFATKQKLVEMRIVVDKTTQTASVYKNDELVKTFPICSGRKGMYDSTNGTFFIYLRYSTQDMRGPNANGTRYYLPGVHWVSYYNGGESFHTAAWNYNGIATGDPAHFGSHGCINMYEQDAQWVYDNCPRGTIVQVTGVTPDGPVRQQ